RNSASEARFDTSRALADHAGAEAASQESTMSLRDKTCIAGIGHTAYTKRGRQSHRGTFALACEAVINAAADAGLPVDAIDGFASFSQDESAGGALAYALGLPELRYSGMVWGGGGAGGM